MFNAFRRLHDWRSAISRIRSKYQISHGRPLRLYRPRRFSEKIQWRKLFDLDPLYAIFCDKLAVRDYIAARIGTDMLVPLLWTGTDPDALPFDDLDPPYVIKSSHGSGQVMIVHSRDGLDVAHARQTMRGWLDLCHGTICDEPGYVPVPHRLMVERQVFDADGERPPERRMFVFGGRVRIINTVVIIDGAVRNGAFHTPNWQRLDWTIGSPLLMRPFPRPQRLDDLIFAAERVAAGLDHARVDFFDCGERIYIGEITLYSWSGMSRFRSDEADRTLGSYWRIRAPLMKAAMTMLLREWKVPAITRTRGLPGYQMPGMRR